jgi:predicted metal-dependent phosphotriesterase family hydrolase
MPWMAYLPERFVPRLRESGGDELVQQILVTNPARYLAFSPNAI